MKTLSSNSYNLTYLPTTAPQRSGSSQVNYYPSEWKSAPFAARPPSSLYLSDKVGTMPNLTPKTFLPLFQPVLTSQRANLRSFATSRILPARPSKQNLIYKHRNIPPYPYGSQHWYKKSNFGLYGSTRPQFGNTVSEKNEVKNRRRWNPNIRHQRFWSEALGRFVRVKVLARVMRTIDKVGGLDEYLLGEKMGRVKELGMGGWALRWRVMRTQKVRERFAMERARLGLVGLGGQGEEVVGVDGEVVEEEEMARQEAAFDRALDKDDRLADKGEDGGLELGDMEVEGSASKTREAR